MTEYNLYRARIEGKRSDRNRFLVRVLPHMADFPDKELLPDFPHFFFHDQPSYDEGDVVWLICEEDFQIGYILGLCEPSIGSGFISELKAINAAEEEAGLPLSAPENLTFHKQMDVALDFYNRSNKQTGRILYNGTVILFGDDGAIFIKNPGSTILFSKEGNVSIKSKDLKEEVKNVNRKAAEVQEAFSKLSTMVDGNAKLTAGAALQLTSGGNRLEATGGSIDSTVVGVKRETLGQGERKRIVTGGSSVLALAGNIEQKAVLGGINLEGATVKITGGTITILGGIIDLKGAAITAPPGGVMQSLVPGPFCAIPICPVTGLPHTGSTFVSLDPSIALQTAAELLTPPPV